jgi:hypothetical protein
MEAELRKIKYNPKSYLNEARLRAVAMGYEPTSLVFANDGIHKLSYLTPEGRTVSFGRLGYGDYLVWRRLEQMGGVKAGTARSKRNVFHKSHRKLPGAWKDNKYSPNNLALRILW